MAAYLFLSASTVAQILTGADYATWGIETSEVTVPAGSVISDATLTIYGVSSSVSDFDVYLLDNPKPDYSQKQKNGVGSVFAGFGSRLTGTIEKGNFVCRFGSDDNNNSRSFIWDTFAYPFHFVLADGRTIAYNSALLELIDYAGTGVSFGIGIESAENREFSFSSLELKVTLSSYQVQSPDQVLTFSVVPGLSDAHPESVLIDTLEFDGTSYVNFGNPSELCVTGNMTVAGWIKTNGTGSTQHIFTKMRDWWSDASYTLYMRNTGQFGFRVYRNGASYTVTTTGTYNDGQWHHVAAVNDGTGLKIYVDGNWLPSDWNSTGGGTIDNSLSNAFLGQRGDGSERFAGQMAQFYVFDRDLEAQEIRALSCFNEASISGEPAGCWNLNEGVGTIAYDSSGHDNHGTIIGGVLRLHKSLVTDGTSYVNFGNPSELCVTGNMTVAGWIKTNGTGSTQHIFTKMRDWWSDASYTLYMRNTGQFGFRVYRNGASYTVTTSGTYNDDQWHHVAAVNDGTGLMIYVDGILLPSDWNRNGGGTIDNSLSNAFLGQRGDGSERFAGQMAQFYVFDRDLEAQEIRALSKLNNTSLSSGPVAHWKLDECIGAIAYDNSGHGNHGAISGGAMWSY